MGLIFIGCRVTRKALFCVEIVGRCQTNCRSVTSGWCRSAPVLKSSGRSAVAERELAAGRIAGRFRGYLPVVVDVETGGFNCATDALLELAAVILWVDEQGAWCPKETISTHVEPFPGANIEPAALQFNGIIPDHPLRGALPEAEALRKIFAPIREAVKESGCTRAILVGHNASFDLGFVNAAVARVAFQTQPLSPVLGIRHGDAEWFGLWSDGPVARRASRRHGLGQPRCPFRDL